MDRRSFLTLLCAGFFATFVAGAHDPARHKSKPTRGEVVSVAGDRIELKTAGGMKTVTITDKTRFERGDQPAARSDVKTGDHLTVYGTTLATGELVAREVLLPVHPRQAQK